MESGAAKGFLSGPDAAELCEDFKEGLRTAIASHNFPDWDARVSVHKSHSEEEDGIRRQRAEDVLRSVTNNFDTQLPKSPLRQKVAQRSARAVPPKVRFPAVCWFGRYMPRLLNTAKRYWNSPISPLKVSEEVDKCGSDPEASDPDDVETGLLREFLSDEIAKMHPLPTLDHTSEVPLKNVGHPGFPACLLYPDKESASRSVVDDQLMVGRWLTGKVRHVWMTLARSARTCRDVWKSRSVANPCVTFQMIAGLFMKPSNDAIKEARHRTPFGIGTSIIKRGAALIAQYLNSADDAAVDEANFLLNAELPPVTETQEEVDSEVEIVELDGTSVVVNGGAGSHGDGRSSRRRYGFIDVSGFDRNFRSWMYMFLRQCRKVLCIFNFSLMPHAGWMNLIDNIYDEVESGDLIDVDGTVVSGRIKMPSGWLGTASDDTIGHFLLFVLAIITWLRERGVSLSTIRKVVRSIRVKFCGDDGVFAVPSELGIRMREEDFIAQYRARGFKVKRSACKVQDRLTGLTWCKKIFVKTRTGVYVFWRSVVDFATSMMYPDFRDQKGDSGLETFLHAAISWKIENFYNLCVRRVCNAIGEHLGAMQVSAAAVGRRLKETVAYEGAEGHFHDFASMPSDEEVARLHDLPGNELLTFV